MGDGVIVVNVVLVGVSVELGVTIMAGKDVCFGSFEEMHIQKCLGGCWIKSCA